MLDAPMRDGEIRIEPAREEHREDLRLACAEDAEIWTIYPASFLDPHFDAGFDAFFADARARPFILYAQDALVGMTSFLGVDEANRSLALLMLDGFSYREMSQILGLGESNVGMKINRIKAALAARLAMEELNGL